MSQDLRGFSKQGMWRSYDLHVGFMHGKSGEMVFGGNRSLWPGESRLIIYLSWFLIDTALGLCKKISTGPLKIIPHWFAGVPLFGKH
jgi:hypothetical protein